MTGVTKLRRKLRRVPAEATKELRTVVRTGLEAVARDARAGAPRDEGDLVDSIVVKISRDGLTGLVGPGANAAEIVRRATGSTFGRTRRKGPRKGEKMTLSKRNRHAWFQMWKGYWAEFGTKGAPDQNIPPQPARPFMTPAYDSNRLRLRRTAKKAIDRALKRAARG